MRFGRDESLRLLTSTSPRRRHNAFFGGRDLTFADTPENQDVMRYGPDAEIVVRVLERPVVFSEP